jgi:molybdopterin synthase sulfur carrier subunit
VATVCVHGPLRRLAGGRSEIESSAPTVRALLRAVEAAHPDLTGWVLDERELIRRHIHVYVNGERADEDAAVAERDRVEVLPAISGG